MNIVSQLLKQERTRKGLTQKDVEQLTHINYKTLSGYENNVSEPNLETLKVLTDLYGVTTDYILGREELTVHQALEDDAFLDFIAVWMDEVANEGATFLGENTTGIEKLHHFKSMNKEEQATYLSSMLTKIIKGNGTFILERKKHSPQVTAILKELKELPLEERQTILNELTK